MDQQKNIFTARFSLVFGIWTLVALCEAASDYLITHSSGTGPSLLIFLRSSLSETWTWAAFTPIVFLIARRFPLSRPGWVSALCVHLACFALLSLLHSAIYGLLDPANARSTLKLQFLSELYSDIWMYWPLVCIQALLDSQARIRDRDRVAAQLEAQLTKSSLALLRAQIQPHFLFNTLNAISALVRIDALAAEDMIADLAEVLRASFSDPISQESPLRHELQLVRCYLRIQCRRFDRLTVDLAVSPEALDALIPALLLQSLVENAVVHGIAPADRPCTIRIEAGRRGDQLLLSVVDDGMGLAVPNRDGVGLSNARSRLRQLYPGRHFLDLHSEPKAGTSITVSIPFQILSRVAAGAVIDDENTNPDRGRRSLGSQEPGISVIG